MRPSKFFCFVLPLPFAALVAVAACSGTTPTTTTEAGAEGGGVPDASPPRDTAPPDTAPALPPPASVPLTSGACPGFEPCGGALEGTFDYSAGCIPDNALSQVNEQCKTAKFSNLKGTISGRITFAGGKVVRKANVAIAADLNVPGECTALLQNNCQIVGGYLATVMKSANCKEAAAPATGCDCKAELDLDDDRNDTFTVSGNTLRIGSGDEYEYCVKGGQVAHRQSRAATAQSIEPGIFQAQKR